MQLSTRRTDRGLTHQVRGAQGGATLGLEQVEDLGIVKVNLRAESPFTGLFIL
jgi:hypothetical protein